MSVSKLTRLDREAAQNEDSANSKRWDQAQEIDRRLKNETERQIAASWINARTGKPYTQQTVSDFAAAWREFHGVPRKDRPAFWKAVEKAKGTSTRSERNESQPPKSIDTAAKLVENIVEKSPPEVQVAVIEGLAEALAPDPESKPRKGALSIWDQVGGRCDKARRGAVRSLSDLRDESNEDLPPEITGDLIASAERVSAAYELLIAFMRGGGVKEIENFLAEQEA